MNNTSEQLLSAIDILVDNAVLRLRFDKTVLAEITDVVNIVTGEYKVRYEGNVFSAFAPDGNAQYEKGDTVYLTIPESDYSNRKIINGKVTSKSLSEDLTAALNNTVVNSSPNFDVIYDKDWSVAKVTKEDGSVEIKSYLSALLAGETKEEGKIGTEDNTDAFFTAETETENDLFKKYAQNNDALRIKASFLTQFKTKPKKGNYGIIIEFYTTLKDKDENPITLNYVLDMRSFNGDPYSFSVYSPQAAIFPVTPGLLTGIKSVIFFESGFEDKNEPAENLFVKDLEISFVKQKDLTDNLYYLNIFAPDGTIFKGEESSLNLLPQLIYKNQNVLTDSNSVYKWFIRDASVIVESEKYDKDAGIGWSLKSNERNLIIESSEVKTSLEYKLIVIYNNEVALTDTVVLYNMDSQYDFSLLQYINEEGNVGLRIINNKDKDEDEETLVLVGDWYLSKPGGEYGKISTKTESVDLQGYLIQAPFTVTCEVYNGEAKIGILTYTIANSLSSEDVIVSYVGETAFRYDANGDLTFEDTERDRTLTPVLTWKEGVIGNYSSVDWYLKNEKISSSSSESLKTTDSMMQNLWVDSNNILHYNILLKFNINKTNNTLILKITTGEGKVYEFQKEIIFLKDGDLGTNGTTYMAVIRPYDNNKLISGFYPFIINKSENENNFKLKCSVYKDGEPVSSNVAVTYKWTLINCVSNSTTSENITVTKITKSGSVTYAKVEVKVDNILIYAYYPISVISSSLEGKIETNLPLYVKYSSSGVNPVYYNDILTLKIKDRGEQITEVKSSDSTLLYIDVSSHRLSPSYSFSGGDAVPLLQYVNGTDFIYHPVIMYLDTYGNEAINSWDGLSVTGSYTLDTNSKPTSGRLYYTKDADGNFQPITISSWKPDTYYYATSILAPLIGAGEKDNANRFTGIVMGKDTGQNQVGLYGYSAGINTFGLKADGSAFFGDPTKGRMEIDPTGENVILKGFTSEDKQAMTINLTEPNDDTKYAIVIGETSSSTFFYVDYKGELHAKGATISGDLTVDGSATIGGWTILGSTLVGGPNKDVVLNGGTGEIIAKDFECRKVGSIFGNMEISNEGDGIKFNNSDVTAISFSIQNENNSIIGALGLVDSRNSGLILGLKSKVGSIAIESEGAVRLSASLQTTEDNTKGIVLECPATYVSIRDAYTENSEIYLHKYIEKVLKANGLIP